MNRLSRSTALKIAAVITLVLALLDLVIYEIPPLMLGQVAVDQIANGDGSGPPFFMVLLQSAFDILAIVASYGAWRAQRWGVILVIVISAFSSLTGILGVLFAGDATTRIFAAVGVVLSLAAIVLCLWRERVLQGHTVQASS